MKDFSYNLPVAPFSNFSDISSKMSDISSYVNINITRPSSRIFSRNLNTIEFNDSNLFFYNNILNSVNLNNLFLINDNSDLSFNSLIFSNYFSDFLNFNTSDFLSKTYVPSSKLSYALDSLINKNSSSRFSGSDDVTIESNDYSFFLNSVSSIFNFNRFNLILNFSFLKDSFYLNNISSILFDRLFNFYNLPTSLFYNSYLNKFDDTSIFFMNSVMSSIYSSKLFNLVLSSFNYNSLFNNNSLSIKSPSIVNLNNDLLVFTNMLNSFYTNFYFSNTFTILSSNSIESSRTSTFIINNINYTLDISYLSFFLCNSRNFFFNNDFLNNLNHANLSLYSQKFNRVSVLNLDPIVFNYKLVDSSLQLVYSNSYLLNNYFSYRNNFNKNGTLSFNSSSSVLSSFNSNVPTVNVDFTNFFLKSYNFSLNFFKSPRLHLTNLLSFKQNNNFVEYFYKNNDDLDMNFISKFLLPDIVSTRNLNKFNKFNFFLNNLNFSVFSRKSVSLSASNDSFILFNFLFFKNISDIFHKNNVNLSVFLNDFNYNSINCLFSHNKYNIFKTSFFLNLNKISNFKNSGFKFNSIDFKNLIELFSNNRSRYTDFSFLKLEDSVSNQKRLNISKGIFLPSDMNIHLICGSKDVIHS